MFDQETGHKHLENDNGHCATVCLADRTRTTWNVFLPYGMSTFGQEIYTMLVITEQTVQAFETKYCVTLNRYGNLT